MDRKTSIQSLLTHSIPPMSRSGKPRSSAHKNHRTEKRFGELRIEKAPQVQQKIANMALFLREIREMNRKSGRRGPPGWSRARRTLVARRHRDVAIRRGEGGAASRQGKEVGGGWGEKKRTGGEDGLGRRRRIN